MSDLDMFVVRTTIAMFSAVLCTGAFVLMTGEYGWGANLAVVMFVANLYATREKKNAVK